MSFEIVSYFDIRISNLVAAKGRARNIRGKDLNGREALYARIRKENEQA